MSVGRWLKKPYQVLLWLCALCYTGSMLGCTTLATRTVVYSEAELNEKLNQKLLLEQNVLHVFRLKTLNPKINLLPEKNRVLVAVDIALVNTLSRATTKGQVKLSGELGFDRNKRRVLLKQPRLEHIALPDIDHALHFSMSQYLRDNVNSTFSDLTIYELKPEDLRYVGIQFDPTKIAIKPDGLHITVAPR
jgi:Protein of unknown function (DUF1439)